MIQNKSQMKQSIEDAAYEAKRRNEEAIESLGDRVSLSEYRSLVRSGPHGLIWTDALQTALIEETDYKNEQFAVIHPGGAVGARLNAKKN